MFGKRMGRRIENEIICLDTALINNKHLDSLVQSFLIVSPLRSSLSSSSSFPL